MLNYWTSPVGGNTSKFEEKCLGDSTLWSVQLMSYFPVQFSGDFLCCCSPTVFRHAKTDITKPRIALAGLYRHLYVCPCVRVHVAFQRKHPCSVLGGQVLYGDCGPIFQMAALVRSLTGTQIVGIDFAQPQWKREGCDCNEWFGQTWTTFKVSSPPLCRLLYSPKEEKKNKSFVKMMIFPQQDMQFRGRICFFECGMLVGGPGDHAKWMHCSLLARKAHWNMSHTPT